MVLVNLDLGKRENQRVESFKKKWRMNKKETIRKMLNEFKGE